MTDYIGMILQGLFTGFGVVAGTHIYDMFFRKKMEQSKEIINKIPTTEKKIETDNVVNKILGKNNQ